MITTPDTTHPMDAICRTCGHAWGSHHLWTDRCPVYTGEQITGWLETVFEPHVRALEGPSKGLAVNSVNSGKL